jgi:hypothetical protein
MARIRLKKQQEELDPRAYEMANIIMDMRTAFTYMPVETGYVCLTEAFQDNPYAETAQDMGRVIAKTEERAWRKFKKIENVSRYAMWAIISMGAMVLGIYVLSGVLFK